MKFKSIFIILLIIYKFSNATEIKVFPLKIDFETEKRKIGIIKRIEKEEDKTFQIIAKIQSSDDIYTETLSFNLFLFDRENELLETITQPVQASHQTKEGKANYVLPTILRNSQIQTVFFEIPFNMESQVKRAILVVHHENNYFSNATPNINLETFNYSLKDKVTETSKKENLKSSQPKTIDDKIVEYKVRTGLEQYPELTLFLKMPENVKRFEDVKGVIAMCLVTRRINVESRAVLEGMDVNDDYFSLFSFANEKQFAILAWGVGPLVNIITNTKSFDEVSPEESQKNDQNFDAVARAWESGVNYFVSNYKIPSKGYLGWGLSSSAQWIHRLALRKSERFLALHVHVNSSYDKPTDDGKKTFWLVTTGEREWGYESSKKFYKECRDKNYPIIFKAEPRLGHASSGYVNKLEREFFNYALSLKPLYDQIMVPDEFGKVNLPANEIWVPAMNKPLFMGDFLNQMYMPVSKADFIPLENRVFLPTEAIAKLWVEPKY